MPPGGTTVPNALPRRDPHRPRGTPRPSKRARVRALVLVGVHVLAAVHIAHWLGSGRSLGPLEPSESGETLLTGAVNAGFVFFLLLILSTLVLGRFFCGWACHLVALQDLCGWLLGKLGLRPRPLRARLLALVPLFAAVEMFVLPSLLSSAGHGTGWQGLSLELTTDDFWGRFPGLWIALATFLVDGFLIVWWLGSKGFCTYGCPYGAIFGLADRVAPGRIRVTDACEGCGHCTATCTSNVRVHEEVARYGMVVDPGCMKCMDCVSVCPKDALYFGFGGSRGKALKRAAAGSRPRRRYDLSWPEELGAALLFAGSFFATRGLYDRIPFLLAIGLSVLVAIAGVCGWRLLRRADFSIQHAVLRRGGRFTRRGATAFAGIAATLALTAHSGLVQYHDRAGTRALERAAGMRQGEPARAREIDGSLAHLRTAARLGLVPTASLENRLGQVLGARGDFDAAERHARRAIELEPTVITPRLQLADLALRRGRPADAIAPLAEVLEREPAHPDAVERLTRVIGADVDLLEAHVLLAGALHARGDGTNARNGLEWVLEREPDHAGAGALLERIGAAD